jgi:peptidyl-prolyl cis-trans isomerase B (cyclophilin B)
MQFLVVFSGILHKILLYFLSNLSFSTFQKNSFTNSSFSAKIVAIQFKEKGVFIMAQNPVVTFEMENGDIMKAELYPDIAPNTVNNFISLINKGFYNGLIFHRVIEGFMIQGGCPNGNGMGGPGYSIKGEFSQNGFSNQLKHTPGVLSMARAMHPDSAGSQFFIMHKNSPHLDGAYAAFGQVTEGLDIVNKIAETPTDYRDRPMTPQVMKAVTVETFGVEYPEPETV